MSRELPCRMIPYDESWIPRVLETLRITMGETIAIRREEPFWRWKHHRNPFGVSYGILCWNEGAGVIAGLRILMRWRFHTPDGQTFSAVRAVDTATHPSFRRKGIFAALTAKAVEELKDSAVHFIFNTPNEKSRPGYLKLGWKVVGTVPLYVRVRRWRRFLWGVLGKIPQPKTLPPLSEYFTPEILPWREFVQTFGQETVDAIIQTAEQNRKPLGLRTSRNLGYFNWRYGEHPYLSYGVLPLIQKESLVGFLVLRPNLRFGLREIVITEFVLCDFSVISPRTLSRLLKRHVKGDYWIAHFHPKSLEMRFLLRSGFFKISARKMVLAFRELNVDPDPFLNLRAWDLSLGDLEIF